MLSIDVKGEEVVHANVIPLFDSEDGRILPQNDATLRQHIAKCFGLDEDDLDNKDRAVKELNRAKSYYRAIGRLMIHSLATGHVLPFHIMPPFFRACKFLLESAIMHAWFEGAYLTGAYYNRLIL